MSCVCMHFTKLRFCLLPAWVTVEFLSMLIICSHCNVDWVILFVVTDQTAFGAFMGELSVSSLITHFCWYHIDAPGQVCVCVCA